MADDREPLGRIVHEIRLAWNAELPHPRGVLPWEQRDEGQKEMDMRIAAAVRDAVLNSAPAAGELVRETWVYWALEQPDVAEHPNWLKSWAELDERDREVDDRIYSAVAAKAVHDAGLVNERRDAQLFALQCHLPAVLDALSIAVADQTYGARAKRFRDAMEALTGSEGDDRG